jgi:hypothetical protein
MALHHTTASRGPCTPSSSSSLYAAPPPTRSSAGSSSRPLLLLRVGTEHCSIFSDWSALRPSAAASTTHGTGGDGHDVNALLQERRHAHTFGEGSLLGERLPQSTAHVGEPVGQLRRHSIVGIIVNHHQSSSPSATQRYTAGHTGTTRRTCAGVSASSLHSCSFSSGVGYGWSKCASTHLCQQARDGGTARETTMRQRVTWARRRTTSAPESARASGASSAPCVPVRGAPETRRPAAGT